jgi:2-isopropylmalate synthase
MMHRHQGECQLDAVALSDTTIRELAHAPDASLSIDETLVLACGLAHASTDGVEVGAPGRSPWDYEAVRRVADQLAGHFPACTVTAVARCAQDDIARAAEALQPAAVPRLHLVLPVSATFAGGAGGSGTRAMLDLVGRSVGSARGLLDQVQLSVAGTPRIDVGQLTAIAHVARDAGAELFNVCDLGGSAFPQEFGGLVGELVKNLPELTYGVRCSNKLGLAIGNTLAGLSAGARQVDVSVGGFGRGSHACSYEGLSEVLTARRDTLDLRVAVRAEELASVTALVADFAGGVSARMQASLLDRPSATVRKPVRGLRTDDQRLVTLGRPSTDVLPMVLTKLCDGVKDETAARQMRISARTYRRYVAQLMKELNVSSRFEAGVKVAESGLLRAIRARGIPA